MRDLAASFMLAAALGATPVSAQPPTQAPAVAHAPVVQAPVVQAPAVQAPPARLSTASGIRELLADEKAKDVLMRHAPQVVEFFGPSQDRGAALDNPPLETIALIPQAQEAGLTPDNLKKIATELAGL